MFDEFWAAYPRRKGANPKHAARLKFEAAVKKGDSPDVIIEAARLYARELEAIRKLDSEFVAMASTWLNQRRWEDYIISQTAPPKPKFFVQIDTPEWMAWEEFWLTTGRRSPPQTDHRCEGGGIIRGWWFDSEWPPTER